MSILEILAVAISLLGIWCTAKRWVLCWPLNIVACALYFNLFYEVKLYADMGLQLLFGLFIIYGWFSWVRGKAEEGELSVQPLRRRRAFLGLGLGAVGAVSIGWLLHQLTDASLPWLDASLSSFSLVAQFWTARRHAESWLLWIVLDVIYVGMFAYKSLWLTAGLYTGMTMLAILGYRAWRKASQPSHSAIMSF